MTKKAFKFFNRKSLKKETIKKEVYIQYMELIDDNLILFHRSKSFKEVLGYNRAIELLTENKNIFITSELDDELKRYYIEKLSA